MSHRLLSEKATRPRRGAHRPFPVSPALVSEGFERMGAVWSVQPKARVCWACVHVHGATCSAKSLWSTIS